MSLGSQIYELLVRFKQSILSDKFQEALADLFFAHLPVSVIKLLTVEYKGYLNHYSPREGNVVVDAGAWKGHFTIIASRLVGVRGTVIAIEPQETMCDKLERRIERLEIENVIVVNQGLYDEDSVKTFPKKSASSFSITARKEQKEHNEFERITLRKLDTILRDINIESVDFIKMDIEGAEIEALLGASNTLTDYPVHLAIASYHVVDGERTFRQVEQILKSYGYEVETGYPDHLTTYAWREARTETSK